MGIFCSLLISRLQISEATLKRGSLIYSHPGFHEGLEVVDACVRSLLLLRPAPYKIVNQEVLSQKPLSFAQSSPAISL